MALGVLGEHGVLSEFIYDGISEETAAAIGHPPTGKGVLGTVIRENEVVLLDSISSHDDSVGFPANHPPMTTFLGVPVSAGGEAFGNLYLANRERPFDESDVAAITALSRIAGVAVYTARLQTRLRRVALVEDRQRIARDLHDSVIQDLFAVGLSLQGLQTSLGDSSPDQSDLLTAAIDSLEDSVNTLRRYVFELRDTTPAASELDERIQSLVARMGSAYPAQVQLIIDPISNQQWHDDVLLLITEALSNALRHSGADHVTVEVGEVDGVLHAIVSDDGSGFSVQNAGGGMGLANMKTRAESLAGTLVIDSVIGEGTTVTATVPVSRD